MTISLQKNFAASLNPPQKLSVIRYSVTFDTYSFDFFSARLPSVFEPLIHRDVRDADLLESLAPVDIPEPMVESLGALPRVQVYLLKPTRRKAFLDKLHQQRAHSDAPPVRLDHHLSDVRAVTLRRGAAVSHQPLAVEEAEVSVIRLACKRIVVNAQSQRTAKLAVAQVERLPVSLLSYSMPRGTSRR